MLTGKTIIGEKEEFWRADFKPFLRIYCLILMKSDNFHRKCLIVANFYL